MTSFLFWNLNGKPLQTMVANLALRHEVDVIMLAECSIPPATMLQTLNPDGTADYHDACYEVPTKIKMFSRFSRKFLHPLYNEAGLTIRHLILPGLTPLILAVAHLPSKRNATQESQTLNAAAIVRSIEETEQKIGHRNSVLVGDLNMNPFEPGVAGANALHGVMSRSIAAEGSRRVQKIDYQFFYNPMWGLFGDASPGPPGTYYYRRGEHVEFFWNMFDQVLIRPALLDRFDSQDLAILETDGSTSLVTKSGLPNRTMASDHLPIFFRLKL